MPHRMGSRVREFIVTSPDGSICGLVRIVQAHDGRIAFEWQPATDATPETRVSIPETMRAEQFLAAWMEIDTTEGLRLTG